MLFVYVFTVALSAFADSGTDLDVQHESLKTSVERISDSNQKNTGSSTSCPPPKPENRYSMMETAISEKCTVFGMTVDACTKLVSDAFEIASPYCPTGSLDKEATNCTMLTKYIIQQYEKTPDKYNRILSKVVESMRTNKKNPLNLYDLVLSACDQNKSDAIFTMSLITFGQLLVPDMRATGKTALADSLTSFYQAAGETKNSKIKVVSYPPGFENEANKFQGKGYHFWTRAFLADQLVQKGHSKTLSRAVATSTSVFYEFKIDWAEHKAEGMSFNDRLKGATADVMFSDEGSKFGVE